MFLCFENCKAWGRVKVDQHGNALLFMEIFWCLKYFVCRREEKLYVEGMEDEDMKKERAFREYEFAAPSSLITSLCTGVVLQYCHHQRSRRRTALYAHSGQLLA